MIAFRAISRQLFCYRGYRSIGAIIYNINTLIPHYATSIIHLQYGIPYDGYDEAENYRLVTEEKERAKAEREEKKRKKIEKDRLAREKAKAKREEREKAE